MSEDQIAKVFEILGFGPFAILEARDFLAKKRSLPGPNHPRKVQLLSEAIQAHLPRTKFSDIQLAIKEALEG